MKRVVASLLLAPARWLMSVRRGREIPFNVEYRVASLSPTWRLRLRWLVPALRAAGLISLVCAAAGPGDFQGTQVVDSQGIAVELVVDRSGSMLADDYQLEGGRVSRLEAVRAAAERFILGDSTSPGRSADSIGLVTFVARPEVACPLTIDHEAVVAELERTSAAIDYREDGTAIGDAWALAVAQLHSLEQSLAKEAGDRGPTKVAILLTDGQNNAGRLTPERAAGLAGRYGVRTYFVGLEARQVVGEAARQRVIAERERLRPLVAAGGGRLYTVADMRALANVYAEIDALERSKVGEQILATRRHWAVSPFEIGPFAFPPLAVVALMALALESVFAWTLFMEVP
jgi:Ca-activated chloride channel family protein